MVNCFISDPSNRIAHVLGPALLFLCHVPSLEHMVTGSVLSRIKDQYSKIRGQHNNEYNPVMKVPLSVFKLENQLMIEPMEPNFSNNSPTSQQMESVGTGMQSMSVYNELMKEQFDMLLVALNRINNRGIQWQQEVEVSCCFLFIVVFNYWLIVI